MSLIVMHNTIRCIHLKDNYIHYYVHYIHICYIMHILFSFYILEGNNNENSSESDYLPSEDKLHLLEHNALEHNKRKQKKRLVLNTTVFSASSRDVSENIDTACNDEDMQVQKSNAKSIKKNHCLFCSKLQIQLVI